MSTAPDRVGVAVRLIEPAEYEAAGRICVDAYRADGQLSTETGYARVLADIAARAEAGEVLVAIDPSGAVVGTVTFVLAGTRYAELARPGEAEFRMLAVAPAAQGRGVGEALVRACVARAQSLGVRALVISVRDFSAAATRLYQRLGFVRVPEKDWTPVPGVRLLGLRLDLTAR